MIHGRGPFDTQGPRHAHPAAGCRSTATWTRATRRQRGGQPGGPGLAGWLHDQRPGPDVLADLPAASVDAVVTSTRSPGGRLPIHGRVRPGRHAGNAVGNLVARAWLVGSTINVLVPTCCKPAR